jgi:tubulin-specific chaperone A
MAKVISDEILKLKIVINGDEAQKRVLDLEQANKVLSFRLQDLIQKEKELSVVRKAEEKNLNTYKNSVAKLTEKLKENEMALINEVKTLRSQQSAFEQGSKEYEKLQQKIDKVKVKSQEATKAISAEIASMTVEQNKYQETYNKTIAKHKELSAEIDKTKTAIGENKTKIDDEVRSMNIMNLTIDQLTRRANDLKYAMRHMAAGEGLDAARNEYQQLTARIRELTNGAEESAWSLRNLADRFNQYSGMIVAFVAGLTGMAVGIQQTIDLNNKMADAQTAVAKTTGMTTDEVKELTLAYSEFDTRTSKLDLLKIAEVGGRLGVPKQEIKDFTQEVDKAYVALGDSFSGGVEKVAEKIGKIKGLFKETKDLEYADAINEIGSALNELGANGAASEENMADFTLRIGQLPEALKPTVAEALALAAAFEESGIDAERASSGYSKFVRVAATDTAKFAQVMHISQKEVETLLNQDPLQFFLKFSEGAKGLDATVLASILDGLKLNDNEVISIIGAASENTDKFRKSIEFSNQALAEATSLQKEFDQVNNNSAAIYEKVRKKFIAMFSSDTVVKSLNWIISVLGKMLGVVDDTTGRVTMLKDSILFMIKIITIGTVSMISYNSALALSAMTLDTLKARLLSYSIIQQANNLRHQVAAAVQNIWNLSLGYSTLALGRLTASTTLQTAAQQRLNLVTSANPWGALLTVVMACVTAYALFADHTDELAAKEKLLNEIKTKATSATVNEKVALENLLMIAKDENQSKENRLQAIKKLNEISPKYLGNLTLENIRTAEGTRLINDYVRALDKKAMAEVLSSKRAELLKKQYELQGAEIKPGWMNLGGAGTWVEQKLNSGNLKREMSTEEAKGLNALANTVAVEKELSKYVPLVAQAYRKRRDELRANFNEMKDLNMETKKFISANPEEILNNNSSTQTSNYTPLGTKEKKEKKTDAEKAAEKAENAYQTMRKKILESQENYDQKELELEAQKQSALAEQKQNGYDKEKSMLIAERDKRLAELEKQKVKQSDFDDIDKIIAREKGGLQEQFKAIKAQWLKENQLIEDTKIAEKEKTNFKLLQLDDKYLMEDYKQREKAMQESLNLITREQNQTVSETNTVEKQKKFLEGKGYSEATLAMITTWEQGKAEIEKYYQKKSLEEQLTFLQDQVAMFEMMTEVAPEFITAEQIETIQTYKDKIAALLAEITKLKNGEEQKLGGKLSSFGAGNADIFGLTPDQWKAMFTNTDNLSEKIQKVGAAVQIAQNMFGQYSSFVQANEQRMMQRMEVASDRKKKKLKNQLDSGIITQEEYKKQTILIDAELDKKKAQLEYQQAKRQRAMQISQAISGVAMAVINAAQTQPFFPLGLAMTVVAGAMGAVQLATIMNTPLPSAPGAEDGFYPVLRSQDNKMFNARRRKSKTGIYDEPTMLVGEAGATMPELVVSGKTMKRIDPSIQKMYMNEIRRVEGFENGLYPTQTNSSGSDELLVKAMDIIKENTQVIDYLKKNGVRGYFVKSARFGKDVKDATMEYENLINKNRY